MHEGLIGMTASVRLQRQVCVEPMQKCITRLSNIQGSPMFDYA